MSKTVKMGTRLKGNYVISLPGGVRIVPDKLSEVPVEVLENPGVKAYLKTGKLYIQEEEQVIEVPAKVVAQEAPKVEAPVTEPAKKEKKPRGAAKEVAVIDEAAFKEEVTPESVQAEIAQAVAEVQEASETKAE